MARAQSHGRCHQARAGPSGTCAGSAGTLERCGRALVHGRLKPSNVLVVKDEIKLSSDGVRPFGESTFVADTVSAYDPPEARTGRVSPAGDIWSLGVTLVYS